MIQIFLILLDTPQNRLYIFLLADILMWNCSRRRPQLKVNYVIGFKIGQDLEGAETDAGEVGAEFVNIGGEEWEESIFVGVNGLHYIILRGGEGQYR
jgi:hypothetical protein